MLPISCQCGHATTGGEGGGIFEMVGGVGCKDGGGLVGVIGLWPRPSSRQSHQL